MTNRRYLLAAIGTGIVGSVAGCTDNGESADPNEEAPQQEPGQPDEPNSTETPTQGTPPFEVAYNYRRYDSVPKASGDGRWESDNDTQFVGVTVQVTNPGNEERSLDDAELWVLADGTSQGVNLVTRQSEIDRLTADIEAGETVKAWLLFAAPTDAELGFGKSRFADLSYEFRRDESIEPPQFDRQ